MARESRIERTYRELIADGLILCVRRPSAEGLVEACRAAVRGGLRILEITLTTPGALDAIAELAEEPDVLAGAGTVLSAEDAAAVAAAGGRFALSPVCDPAVVDAAQAHGLLAVPGAATPTEILAARRHGAHAVKVFPARVLGGPDYLRAVRGPLPDIPLIPTNGPDSTNLADWFDAGAVAVGVGAEVFAEGATLQRVERAAGRLRAAREALRGAPGDAESSVRLTSLAVGAHTVQGVACAWEGGQYVTLVAPRGMVACGIFDPGVCERFGFAVAMAHGTPERPLVEPGDVLEAVVDSVSPRARELGIEEGMLGRDALERLL